MEPNAAPPNALWAGLRHGLSKAARATGVYGAVLRGPVPPPPSVAPPICWPGDPDRGRVLLSGAYCFCGETIRGDSTLWEASGAGPGWTAEINGFDWLADIAAVGEEPARRRARALVDDWLAFHDRLGAAPSGALAWRGDVTGRRVWNWLAYFDYLTAGAEDGFAERLRDGIGRQVRHLSALAGREDIGAGRLTALAGLAVAVLTLAPFGKQRGAVGALLERELANAVMPDGCHATRSPALLYRALKEAIALRAIYRAAHEEAPIALQSAIDRMAPAVRFFRHGDGGFAHFNSSREERAGDIDAVLSLAEARGRPPNRTPHGGFERIAAGKLLVLADVGGAPASAYDGHCHAAPFALEVSWGPDRIICNCGASIRSDGEWGRAQRATAAHSTVTVADTNAAEILSTGRIGRRRAATQVERNETQEAVWLDLKHDGYAISQQIEHRRRLYVDLAGHDLRGEDRLLGAEGRPFSVRFHLHPKIQVSLLANQSSALLRTAGGTGWRLRASGADMTLADSVYLAGTNPAMDEIKRTQQIILTGVTGPDGAVVKWALQREPKR